MQRVIRNLFPILALTHHNGKLRELVDENHPIFQQPLFTDVTTYQLLTNLKPKLIMAHGFCPATSMSASGVPGIIVCTREIRELKLEFHNTSTNYNRRVDEMTELLMGKMGLMPQQLVEELLKRFQVNGIVPVGVDDIRRIFTDMMGAADGVMAGVNNRLAAISTQNTSILSRLEETNGNVAQVPSPHVRTTAGIVHYWETDSITHRVPQK